VLVKRGRKLKIEEILKTSFSRRLNIIIIQDQKKDSTNLGTRAFTDGLLKLSKYFFKNSYIELVYLDYRTSKYYYEKLEKKKNDRIRIFEKWTARNIIIGSMLEKIRSYNRIWSNLKIVSKSIYEFHRNNRRNIFFKILNKFFAANIIGHEVLSKMMNADVILINGHSIIMDRYLGRLFVLLLYAHTGKKLNKYVAVINQTVECIKNPFAVELMKYVYERLDYVAVRDKISKQRLVDIGVPSVKIHLAADGAFFLKPKDPENISEILKDEDIGRGMIGLIIRTHITKDYKMWANAIENIEKYFHKEVVYVTTSRYEDKEFIERVSSYISLKVLKGYYDYCEMISIFKKLDIIISDRYHGVIFSIFANTPIVPIREFDCYKINGLLGFFDYPINVLDPISFDNSYKMIESIEYIYDHYDECKAKLRSAMSILKKYSIYNMPIGGEEMAMHEGQKNRIIAELMRSGIS
jgi:polysaccharide pyruvyl transferase WcaK-like protein